MAQQQHPSKGLMRNPLAQPFRALMNFPSMRFPSFWEDLEEEWSSLSNQQNLSISEDDKSIYIEAALPGLNSNEIDVTLDKGILRIRGEKKEEEDQPNKKYHCKACTSFTYRVALPQQVDERNEPQATYKDGILKLTFAKESSSQTRKITIKGNQ